MEGLPFLPGYNFIDPTKSKYHVAQTLGMKNGYQTMRRPTVGIGGNPLNFNMLSEQTLEELSKLNMTYCQTKNTPPQPFKPAFVEWDKKVLGFKGWFKQTVMESGQEHYRVRMVNIFFYLEDDSMSVVEPKVENSGLYQGNLLRRQKIPKNDIGDYITWKDMNVGIEIAMFGTVFHIYECDLWTRNWLEGQGIEVNENENHPLDPLTESRKAEKITQTTTGKELDAKRQFLEMDKKVLRFYCLWDDRDVMFGLIRKCIIQYYLADDTMDIAEVYKENSGFDPFPFLIGRRRIPKDRYDIDPNFNLACMEITSQDVKEYFTPKDFAIGKTLLIYNRRFLIYDVDNFTKAFYWKNFGLTDFTPIDITVKKEMVPKKEIPPYNFHGSFEDSMMSMKSLIPTQPRIDFCKMLDMQGHLLRYAALLDSTNANDACRRFVITYHLNNDTIDIFEKPIKNSGFMGGRFLEQTRVAKPGSPMDNIFYYGPDDFAIGAIIEVFRHRFKITDADRFVLDYFEEHSSQISETTLQSLRDKLGPAKQETRVLPINNCPIEIKRTGDPDELEQLVYEIGCHLKSLSITSNPHRFRLFLGMDSQRVGHLSRSNLQDILAKHQLPCDADIVDLLAQKIGCNPDCITLEEFRQFLEN